MPRQVVGDLVHRRRVGRADHAARLRRPSGTLHSGSSARLTSGWTSHRSSARTSSMKSACPGWMSSTSSPLIARAARRWRRDRRVGLAQPVQAVVPGRRLRKRRDQLERRQRRAARARELPRAGLEASRGAFGRRRAEHAQLGVLRRAVVGDDPVARQDLAARRAAARAEPPPRSASSPPPPPTTRRAAPHQQHQRASRARTSAEQPSAAVDAAAAPPTRGCARAGPAAMPDSLTPDRPYAPTPGRPRSPDMRHPRPRSPHLDPVARARPATAPSIASRWSPRRVDACRRAARRCPPIMKPSGAASIRAPSPRSPSTTVVMRSDSLRRSSSAPCTTCAPPRTRRAARRAAARRSRAGPRPAPRRCRAARADAHDEVADGLAAGGACAAPPRRRRPSARRTRSRPVRVGFTPTPRSTHLRARDERRRGDEERGRGEVTRARPPRPARAGACRTNGHAAVLAAHVHAGRAQHHLGVVAGRQGLDHGRLAVGQQAREQHARLHLRARDRQLVLDPVQVGALDDHRRQPSLAEVDARAHAPQRMRDAVDRPARGCSRRRRASSVPRGWPGKPAGQDAQQGARVADVDRRPRPGRRRAGPRPPARGRVPAPRGWASHEPRAQRGDGLQRRGGVRRAQVAAHLHPAVGHRADDRGAVRDRLVGRRHELARQRDRPDRSATTLSLRCPPARRRTRGPRRSSAARSALPSPATQSAIAPELMSGAG